MKDIKSILENRSGDTILKGYGMPFVSTVIGSQNYGLDTAHSDVDTLTIVMPKISDFVYNRRPKSTTMIYSNGEHNCVKDIRLWIDMLRKCGINFVEPLFSDNVYIFGKRQYQDFWNELVTNRELIANYHPYRTLCSANGMLQQHYAKLEEEYSPKRLSTVLRLFYFIVTFAEGKPYEQCIKPDTPERIISIKEGRCLSPIEGDILASSKAELADEIITQLEDKGINQEAEDFLVDFQGRIMRLYIKESI